jgi:hypothetical protein
VTTRGKLEHLAASFVGEMYPIGPFPSWGFCWNEKGAGLDACGALLYVDRYAAGTSDRNEQAEPLTPRHAKQLQTMDEVSNTCMS